MRISFPGQCLFYLFVALGTRRDRLINLGEDFIIGIVLQVNRPTRTFCVTQAITLTENRLDPGLFALRRLNEADGVIGAGRDTGPARDTVMLIDVADRSGGGNCIPREDSYGTSCRAESLTDRFGDMLRILGGPAQENPFGSKVDRPQFHVGFLEESVRVQ